MFDNITRHFSLKGNDRIAIGNAISDLEIPEEKNDTTPVDLNERDIDSIEIDDRAIIDDLIHVDEDSEDIEESKDERNIEDLLPNTENEINDQLDDGDPLEEVLELIENEELQNNSKNHDDSDIEII